MVVAFQFWLLVVLVMEWILLIVGVYLILIAVVILRIAVLQLLDVVLTASMIINVAWMVIRITLVKKHKKKWANSIFLPTLVFCNQDDRAFIKILITRAAPIDTPKYRSPVDVDKCMHLFQ